MHSKIFARHKTLIGLLATAALCAHAQTIEVEQLGDDELSCQAIYDGTKEMEAAIQNANQSISNRQTAQRANNSNPSGLLGEMARETGSSDGARVANLFGRILAGSGAAVAPQPTVDPAIVRSQAQARKQHLTNLFRDKKCKVSSLRK
jgi:hypothetical protein